MKKWQERCPAEGKVPPEETPCRICLFLFYIDLLSGVDGAAGFQVVQPEEALE